MSEPFYLDDRKQLEEAEIVKIDWPASVRKPHFGIVQDYGKYPIWSKYCRFLENNSFSYNIFDLHVHDWLENAKKFDVIIGMVSNAVYDLQEMRSKYYILETYLGKKCYPSINNALLYEDKCLEAYISQATGIPFARTYVSHEKKDAFQLVENIKYPFVSKIVPSSGSFGVELVHSPKKGSQIVREVFSGAGRKTDLLYRRQKNSVYFQEFIPNDGYDIRVIVVGKWVTGYYRKVLPGDFRASGMNLEEKRELTKEAMNVAIKVNEIIKSPVLAVDMLHGLDGKYYIIEFSPHYLMDSSAELRMNGVPGIYIFDADGTYHFEKGRYWIAELALREFLLKDYLPKYVSEAKQDDDLKAQ